MFRAEQRIVGMRFADRSYKQTALAHLAHARGRYRVVEQHRTGHRADASWDGGDPGRPWLDFIEAHVPDEPPFFFAMYADIDDDRSLPNMLCPDHLPLAGGDDENVSPLGDFRKVPRTRVAECDGRVLAQE